MTKEELIELKDTIERLIEYSQNEIIDKSKIWQFNLIIGWFILVLAIQFFWLALFCFLLSCFFSLLLYLLSLTRQAEL